MCGEQAQRSLGKLTVGPSSFLWEPAFPLGQVPWNPGLSNSITGDRGAGCVAPVKPHTPHTSLCLSSLLVCAWAHPGPREGCASQSQERKGWEKNTLYCRERDGRGGPKGDWTPRKDSSVC